MSALSPTPMTACRARAVLRIPLRAPLVEITTAYRAAVKSAHPDCPGGSAERFHEVVEAYHVLSRPPAADRLFFAPVTVRPSPLPDILAVPSLTAVAGGVVSHRLADGRLLRVTLPPGLRHGDMVRAGPADLRAVIRQDGEVLVRGDDLWITVPLEPQVLAQGGRIAVETPLGRRIVWLTKKASSRGLVRLVGQGLPARGRHRQGHLFLRLTPRRTKADSAARALLRRLTAAWAA